MKMSPTMLQNPFLPQWPGPVIWGMGWLAMMVLDGKLVLGSLAMILVLTASAAALWLRLLWNVLAAAISVLLFNWLFVAPRGTLAINVREDAVLLIVMLSVSLLVAVLMSALRAHALQSQRNVQALVALREWSDKLRDAARIQDCAAELQQLLAALAGVKVAVLVLHSGLPAQNDMSQADTIGDMDDVQRSGLWYCLRHTQQLGPFSGRFERLPDMYLPLRGRNASYGAALLQDAHLAADTLSQAQALCDQIGTALERQHWQRQQQVADQTAQDQELRATLLTAIAHDYRTPLATIMSAGSALEEQDARLNQTQRQQLAHRIVDESARLRQLTANILQLARLDAVGVSVQRDWESADELAGSAVQRCRQSHRIQLMVEPSLPLLRCDPLLVSQVLDNLLENACKYSTPDSPIQLAVKIVDGSIAFSVRDIGPGIPLELQNIVFKPFVQGQALALGVGVAERSGVGLGLALCRAVACVHGGQLRLLPMPDGSCFEFVMPCEQQPEHPKVAAPVTGAV